MDIMKMGKNPAYLGSWDCADLPNREVVLTIAKIVDEKVVANGQSELCTVCHWAEQGWKPMILNPTNKKTLCKLLKTKDTEKMLGRAVIVGIEQVKAFGDVHDALRIRKRLPRVENPVNVVKCTDCGGDIQGAMGKGADYITAYTKKKFGVPLCFDCAQKRSDRAQKPAQSENAAAEVNEHGPAETDG